ncbi:MAG: type III secretion system export apparatus subunit SctS [Granulosicoccaceae bacterium]
MQHIFLLEITQEALTLIILLAAPPVIVAALVGLLIAFVQAATQLQEQSFQFAAKFFAVAVTIIASASFTGGTLLNFTNRIFGDFSSILGQ